MVYRNFLRKTAWLIGFCSFAIPNFVLAQGSPDIIWKRQVSVDRVNSVIFSSAGDLLISGGSDRLINLWRVSDGTLMQTLNTNAPFVHASAVESLSITPDASLLASCSYKIVQLWKLPSGAMQTLNGHTDWVVGVAFSPDGKILASASFDTSVKIWRASDGALLQTIPGVAQQRCVAFSPDGSLLAIAGGEKTIRLFRTSDWTLSATLTGHQQDIYAIAFSPDGTMIASGGYDKTARLWNVADGSLRYTFDGNGGNVYGVAFTPDSSRLAYTDGEGNTIRIYSTSDGALIRKYTSEVDAVQTVAFSRDELLGYGRIDETVVLARINSSAAARISSPASGTKFTAPADITITAAPSKTDGSITKMEFFQNDVKLGEDSTPPFSFKWQGVTAGTYTLFVVDTDKSGATTRSGPVTITVDDQITEAPTISITSPSSGASFNAPAKITISANASASAGVASVEFFQDGISLGQKTKAPYSMTWDAVPMGNYSLTAVVTDQNGATATSVPVEISVAEALPETVKPKVSIISPKSGAKLTTSDVVLSGKASDNVAVAHVFYSLNSSSFRAAEGTENWEASIALQPGQNTVQVKSVDTAGNESDIVTRSFTYIVSSPISIQVNGIGKVSSLKDGQVLQVGKKYTISAKAGKDSIFNGWTGTITTNAAKFSFIMTSDMHLVATFVPNPFAEAKGTYDGLVQSTVPAAENTGSAKFNVTRTGAVSGKLVIGNKNYSVRGKFDGDGVYMGNPNSGLTLNLQLNLADNNDQITGFFSNGEFNSTVLANRNVYNSKSNPAPEAGKYTVVIPANSQDSDSPQGNGFATLKVTTSGSARLAGSLADGTAFSQSAGISRTSTYPMYASLYSRGGSVSGFITFRDQPNLSDLDGTINWFRPPSAKAKTFQDGFATKTTLIGSSYSAVSGAPVLNVPDQSDNIVVNLGDGGLDDTVQEIATFTPKNKISPVSGAVQKFSAKISTSSGTVSGSFIHPVTGAKTSHRGVVFQKQNLASGYFLGSDQSGFISIVPTDQEPSLNDDVTPPVIVDERPPADDSSNPGDNPREKPKKKKHSKD